MKRALIVYHSFDEWEMGPIRIRRIARNLARNGYEPVVLTSPVTSRSTGTVPSHVELIRAKSVDLAEIYQRLKPASRDGQHKPASISRSIGLTSTINRWLMVPDKQVTWRKPAVAAARAYLREHPVDVIFGSLAPRTNLLVARQLAREFNLPCVQEFRDLWTGSPYYHLAQPTALHRRLHAHLERTIIRDATRVTAVCRGLADHLQNKYCGVVRKPIALNYNFYDPEEYLDTPSRSTDPNRPMVISYIGAMYTSRNPFVFFEGMRQFIDQFAITPDTFRFRWVGSVLGVPLIEQMMDRLQLRPYIDLEGQRSHQEALAILGASDISLIIQAPGDQVHIPGKLFEAMGAGVPVLALSDPCEVTDIITSASSGRVCPHDPADVCKTLAAYWNDHQDGRIWHFNEVVRTSYSANKVVQGLANLFDEAILDHQNFRA